jgi:alanine-synthesizing transaminase
MDRVERAMKTLWPRPKMLIISFPHNPTTEVVDLDFFRRVVAFAKENDILLIHDLAYADLVFDGYKAPSILQVPGRRTWRSSCTRCRKGTRWPAGASGSSSATGRWSGR